MAKISKDLVVRLDDVEYVCWQVAEELLDVKGVFYTNTDSDLGYHLIDYSIETVDVLVESDILNYIQGLEVKRLNPDKILVVYK